MSVAPYMGCSVEEDGARRKRTGGAQADGRSPTTTGARTYEMEEELYFYGYSYYMTGVMPCLPRKCP